MRRDLYLNMNEGDAIARCLQEKIGVSAIERLPAGGVRLVCMSSAGAQKIRKALKAHLLNEDVTRERHRPASPLW